MKNVGFIKSESLFSKTQGYIVVRISSIISDKNFAAGRIFHFN